jgi:hypothetical protein
LILVFYISDEILQNLILSKPRMRSKNKEMCSFEHLFAIKARNSTVQVNGITHRDSYRRMQLVAYSSTPEREVKNHHA